MANVATQARYIPYAPVTTVTTTATSTALDQVDNSTNSTATLLLKAFVNRMSDKYHREDERLKTFETWPLPWLDKNVLAQTGMFYTNEEDKCKCYFCEVEIGRWVHEDHPVNEHLRWSPNCPLLRRRTTNNLPINADALDRNLPQASFDVCGSNDTSSLDIRENAYSEGLPSIQSTGMNSFQPARVASPGSSTTPASTNSSNGGNYFPEYPEYAIESARLRSYEDWPRNMKQKPQQLAEAGFFYTGVGDRVRCFSCGGGLKDWDDNDEPWEQHALWLGQCRFVKLIKGQLYIDGVAAAAAQAAKQDEEKEQEQLQSLSVGAIRSAASSAIASDIAPATAAVAVGVAGPPEAAASEGDVAPTAATRIYDKIVAQCGSDSTAMPTAATATGAPSVVPEEKLCKICYAAEYNTAFLPCGHVVACAKCASSVTKCPLCRKPFTDVMRVYFS
ncbi:death-associated inhibitor of apoptosis 1 [Drosophila hydei]|uniref:Death-associated inhibitor of apoptosis 1 n=1 Tax=Drosophila hydei TaxID=7224 RepID=A0A6J1LTU2_DROHY|nr:death-associated inhibitor of apoptosis 1 [Drosophila hydei]XP_023169810.1 death-associated inhibitor of apoptosis 1 [Drosophila hydei]